MEGREEVNSGAITVVGSEAPTVYHVAPRTENPTQDAGSTPVTNFQVGVSPSSTTATATAAATSMAIVTMPVKKKRGRPRKYGPDGSVTMALSPKPISSSAPPSVINFSSGKRGKIRPVGSASKPRMELGNFGELAACSVGANFTPHMMTVNPGEDVTMKIISFSQQGPRAICILSANGVISSVTLRQPDSSGGTLTYEGRFEILSLSGSFMPSESGGTRNRSGGMSVSLASPDGRVVGGAVVGLLVAAGPVQIVVGSFLTANQHEEKPKKQKMEYMPTSIPMAAVPIPSPEVEEYGGQGHHHNSGNPRTNFSNSASFRGGHWSSMPPDSRNRPTDINVTLPGV